MTFKIEFGEDTPEEVKAALSNEAVAAFVGSLVEAAKQPVLANRDELLNELSQFKGKLKDFGGLEGLTAMKTKLTTLETEVNNKSGKEKSLEEMLAESNAKVQQFQEERVLNTVSRKIANAFAGSDVEILEPFIKQRIKHSVDEKGNINVEVYKQDGNPMLKPDGKPADLKDLFNEFKGHPKLGMHIPADDISGSGARASTASPVAAKIATNPFVKGPHENITEQMRLIKNDRATAEMLAAAAGKPLPPA